MIEMTDDSLMPFGKHKGKKLGDVPASYLLWLYDQEGFVTKNPDLSGYIAKNMKHLEKETEDNEDKDGWNR